EYIANELEFIMVGQGFVLIDRSQLDQLRREQNFQMSGEVDDDTAVSIGKVVGANAIITGSVTGTGDLRRLRLRAIHTQTAQVLAVASEKY
ncbi:MAG: CsgG/HfaB family protein, partial [Spirochaetaceae bacterium]|nr:CsgG/HfaB family protein [Spirochaetaceae bacterium]